MIWFGNFASSSNYTELYIKTIFLILIFVAWAIVSIISNIRLGKKFNKSVEFIVGLAILPFIFQPVLGYTKDTVEKCKYLYNKNITIIQFIKYFFNYNFLVVIFIFIDIISKELQ